jgi:predicted anti-sigma-YlaC factor YlaD
MKTHHHKMVYKQICDFMGEDLDAPVCKEVADHLRSCPNCRVYLDTVKKTVTLCQEVEKEIGVPEDVKDRLFKVLSLENFSKNSEDST